MRPHLRPKLNDTPHKLVSLDRLHHVGIDKVAQCPLVTLTKNAIVVGAHNRATFH
jgi:hypothetical protein